MDKLNLEINGRTYTLRPANFFETKTHFTKLLGITKEAIKMQGENVDIDIGQLLANVGSPEFSGVESFILAYASVTDTEGKELLLKNRSEAETHFNAHRNDYATLIIEGLKYHFLDFLPATLMSSAGIRGLVGA